MAKSSYAEKLKDPRWQKKRLEIFERDEWYCQSCCRDDQTLVVHHLVYRNGADPWDYEDHELLTLCADCHEIWHEEMPMANKELLDAIHLGQYSPQAIKGLADAIKGMMICKIPDCQLDIISHAITDPALCNMIDDAYFTYLHNKLHPGIPQPCGRGDAK